MDAEPGAPGRGFLPIRRLFFFFALLLPGSFCCAQQSARVAPADILIVHGKIWTVNAKKPWAQSVAIRKGKIVAIGSDETVERFRGIGTKVIDAGESWFFRASPIRTFI